MPKANDARGNQVAKRLVHRESSGPADWGEVDSRLIAGAVIAVTNQGGAIRFGYTRDGGAYALGILGDGEPRTEYIRPGEDIEAYLRELVGAWSE